MSAEPRKAAVRDGILALIDERDGWRTKARRAEHTLRAQARAAKRALSLMPADADSPWARQVEMLLRQVAAEGE